MNIFVIDDESFARSLLIKQLSLLSDAEILSFDSAAAVTELLEQAPHPDLIYCDLQMPDKDGIQFVRDLAHLSYTGGLVLFSGEDRRILESAQKLAQAYSLKLLASLSKPISIEHLRQTLTNDHPVISTRPDQAMPPFPVEELMVALDTGALVNYYQPKVELQSGRVIGVEALSRWRHPILGLVGPSHFIELAEQHQLIDRLTDQILTNALLDTQGWSTCDGIDLHVAVNISMDNLSSLDFPEKVIQLLNEAHLPPERLMLELTESRGMADLIASLDIVSRLRLKRIGLSIDDFGTGFSSLVKLRDLPFTEMKIDRSFVHGIAQSSTLQSFADTALELAKSLGLRTVAEGVEREEDWTYLAKKGCDLAQGWYIAPAMAADVLPGWILQWNQDRATRCGLK